MGPVPSAQNPQRLSKPLLPTYAYKNSSKIGNQIMTRVLFWLPELLSGLLKLGSGCAFPITQGKKQANTASSERFARFTTELAGL